MTEGLRDPKIGLQKNRPNLKWIYSLLFDLILFFFFVDVPRPNLTGQRRDLVGTAPSAGLNLPRVTPEVVERTNERTNDKKKKRVDSIH